MHNRKRDLLHHILAKHGVRASGNLSYNDYIAFHQHLHEAEKWYFEHDVSEVGELEDVAYEDAL